MDSEKIDEYQEQRARQQIDAIDSGAKGQQKSQEQPINYYNQFCRLYLINTVLTTQLKELTSQKNQLLTKLTRLQKRAQQLSQGNTGQIDEKKRRIRRSASQIARHYKCQIQGCNKSYGSEGSLNQHLKLKHPQLFKSLSAFMPNHGIVKESYGQSESD